MLLRPEYNKEWLSNEVPRGDIPVSLVRSHFFDSGSFTLRVKAERWGAETGQDMWSYYDLPEFYAYMDAYAGFVKTHAVGIDFYANVDAIPNPELSWRNQQYLESKHGLSPIPVVHYKTPLKWLRHYITKGYPYIALGGLAWTTSQDTCQKWIDACFEMVCDTPDRLPKVKIHGFGIGSFKILRRYPWYSIDSSAYSQKGAYGYLVIPHKTHGKFDYIKPPFCMAVSMESPCRKQRGRHYFNITRAEQRHVEEWVEHTGLEMGSLNPDGTIKTFGVITRHVDRRVANLLFYEEYVKHMRPYPWPWTSRRRRGLGIIL